VVTLVPRVQLKEGDKVDEPRSAFYGKRMKNGWKNGRAPWTYDSEPGAPLAHTNVGGSLCGAGIDDCSDGRSEDEVRRDAAGLERVPLDQCFCLFRQRALRPANYSRLGL
jgi:hypothetical protein